jgi:hypothetical protein
MPGIPGSAPAAPPIAPPVPAAAYGQAVAPSTGTSGKAIASLILGIGGILVCPVVLSVLAIVFGVQAKNDIDRGSGQGGRGMAQAGFVLGIVGLALTALTIVVVVIAGATK